MVRVDAQTLMRALCLAVLVFLGLGQFMDVAAQTMRYVCAFEGTDITSMSSLCSTSGGSLGAEPAFGLEPGSWTRNLVTSAYAGVSPRGGTKALRHEVRATDVYGSGIEAERSELRMNGACQNFAGGTTCWLGLALYIPVNGATDAWIETGTGPSPPLVWQLQSTQGDACDTQLSSYGPILAFRIDNANQGSNYTWRLNSTYVDNGCAIGTPSSEQVSQTFDFGNIVRGSWYDLIIRFTTSTCTGTCGTSGSTLNADGHIEAWFGPAGNTVKVVTHINKKVGRNHGTGKNAYLGLSPYYGWWQQATEPTGDKMTVYFDEFRTCNGTSCTFALVDPAQGGSPVIPAPTFASCGTLDNNTIQLCLNGPTTAELPIAPATGATGLSCRENAAALTISGSDRVGQSCWDINFATTLTGGTALDCSYAPASGNIINANGAGTELGTLTNQTCTNTVPGTQNVVAQVHYRGAYANSSEGSDFVAAADTPLDIESDGARCLHMALRTTGGSAGAEDYIPYVDQGGGYYRLGDAYTAGQDVRFYNDEELVSGSLVVQSLALDAAVFVSGGKVRTVDIGFPGLAIANNQQTEWIVCVETRLTTGTFSVRMRTSVGGEITYNTDKTPILTVVPKRSRIVGGGLGQRQ